MTGRNRLSSNRLSIAALLLAATTPSASAAELNFSYSQAGTDVATGSFSYADGLTGVLNYNDLSAFSVTLAGVTYNLSDVLPLTDYKNFAYDTAANTFIVDTNSCGFSGCGFQSSLSAINSSASFGFFFNAAPGSFNEYSTQTSGSFDTITISPANTGAVPEPATWALMLLGFGLIGSVMRKSPVPVRVSFSFA